MVRANDEFARRLRTSSAKVCARKAQLNAGKTEAGNYEKCKIYHQVSSAGRAVAKCKRVGVLLSVLSIIVTDFRDYLTL